MLENEISGISFKVYNKSAVECEGLIANEKEEEEKNLGYETPSNFEILQYGWKVPLQRSNTNHLKPNPSPNSNLKRQATATATPNSRILPFMQGTSSGSKQFKNENDFMSNCLENISMMSDDCSVNEEAGAKGPS